MVPILIITPKKCVGTFCKKVKNLWNIGIPDDRLMSVGTVLSLGTVPIDKIWSSVGSPILLTVGKILLSNLHVFGQLCANLPNLGS